VGFGSGGLLSFTISYKIMHRDSSTRGKSCRTVKLWRMLVKRLFECDYPLMGVVLKSGQHNANETTHNWALSQKSSQRTLLENGCIHSCHGCSGINLVNRQSLFTAVSVPSICRGPTAFGNFITSRLFCDQLHLAPSKIICFSQTTSQLINTCCLTPCFAPSNKLLVSLSPSSSSCK